ncbi:hypothetical protein SARC_09588 [Sphaeroforma arctica JP610]|uniref:Nudix hydrolase domain-containing protein n=1 Tax=Sphaeroforma arctica JP610 TaxID=667725 RepID=A0A0L0FNA1_9EUKA|nr:hypothetical protein SARC_09588 [Sphaeroforma arctica JP610]KNC77966.1 hypothetical protein SARC_09588 [Sphaeroforma arctica JP610]|eukprot:XP_014151868.1 hypothetical protein SARC_09588 [Sphaeroforma arctica JP610]
MRNVEVSALCQEEGGVLGTIDRPLGTWIATSKKSGKASRLHVFLLHVTEELSDSEWAESDVRQRRWVDLEYALEVVHREEQHNALLTFKQSLV